MRRLLCTFVSIVTFLALAGTIAHSDPAYVWLEGEAPTTISPALFKADITDVGAPQYLSGGKWIHVSIKSGDVAATAPGGVTLSYSFKIVAPGTYDIWSRIGYQASRTTFEWRIDGEAWQTVKPGQPFIQLQQLQTWNDVSWMHFGNDTLAAGQHKFDFKIPPDVDAKGQPLDVQFACDAICLYAGHFLPNDQFKPGDESWQTDNDRAAADAVINVVAPDGAAQTATSLDGMWQIARYDEEVVHNPSGPIDSLGQIDNLAWKAIAVPGDRDIQHPEWLYSHRYLLRTRVNIPASVQGHSVVLHFPSLNMLATVFVNGEQCGFDDTPLAAWDCDITKAVHPGQLNEIVVGIKDWYYALPDIGATEGSNFKYIPTDWVTKFGPANFVYPVWNQPESGILASPSLLVTGNIYTSDVFCQPSVQNKALNLSITLHNGSDTSATVTIANSVSPLAGGPAEIQFIPTDETVAANSDKVVELSQPWSNPKLWWPDDPRQYAVTTTVSLAGKPIDSKTTKFGFREWSWSGDNFKLNDIPFHGRADTSNFGPALDDTWLQKYHTHGQDFIRDWDKSSTVDSDLDWYDAHGVNVRRSGIFDGEAARYNILNLELWANYRKELAAWIKGERNHPSIFIWSVENEVTFINGHVTGQDQFTTDQHHLTAPVVEAADPTRPFMVDGGNALLDESFPVYGGHYMEPPFESLPDGAYDKAGLAHRQVWPVTQHKPILLGEAFYWNGNDPGDFATAGGDAAFVGKAEAAPAIGLTGKMLSEGYRWNDVNFQFWGGDTSNLYYNSWQPIAALCREWDSAFESGQEVARTVKIFNDKHDPAPITLKWAVTFGGQETARGSKTYAIEAGTNQLDTLVLPMPRVSTRTDGYWTISLYQNGIKQFTDIRPISVLPNPKLSGIATSKTASNAIPSSNITVFDPSGTVQSFLKSQTIPFSTTTQLSPTPQNARLLIVGSDAISQQDSDSSRLAAFAATGRTVIVLDQTNPLKFQALPGAMETSTDSGEIAFPEDLSNPLFAGLSQSDFFTWYGGGNVYRSAYRKPTSSGRSLVECGFRLQDCALAEMTPGKGLMLISQLALGEKLASSVVAQRLLLNMISVGLAYKQVFRPVSVCAVSTSPLIHTLDAIGLKYNTAETASSALAKSGGIAVIDANPTNLGELAANPSLVNTFVTGGGWIILNNLTPDGLIAYNKLVGVDHIIRRFGQNATMAAWFGAKHIEKVTLAAQPSPLLTGLSPSNVVLNSGQQIFGFEAGQLPAEDGYSYVVDTGDVAPFATSTWGSFGNITNGFTQEDGFWPLIINFPAPTDGTPFQLPIKLARPETLASFDYAQDLNYLTTSKISLLFDGQNKVSYNVLPNGDVQHFVINPPQHASTVTFEINDWVRDPSKAPNLGLDNIWLYPQRPTDFSQRVKPMLNIGALVEYPKGNGGIVLCNVDFKDAEAYPENVGKKQAIIATILRNLSAPFSGSKSIIAGAGDLTYRPLDISKNVNQFKNEQGWFGDRQYTFADLPGGLQRYAGVTYSVYNFTTSPVPTVIMLGGNGIPGSLPDSVNGIAVNSKADALFFLQAARIDQPLSNDEVKQGMQPEIADYIVHYADGKIATIPVTLGGTIDDYHQQNPNQLPGAQIAWTKPYPSGGLTAVAYSQQWNNPRPDVTIITVDLVYGPERRGVPALLAITAARTQ